MRVYAPGGVFLRGRFADAAKSSPQFRRRLDDAVPRVDCPNEPIDCRNVP